MPPELSGSKSDPLAELAEAEAAETQALAEAALAQERAAALRGEVAGEPARPARGRWAGVATKAAFALAGLAAGAAVVLTVLMLSQHSEVAAQRAHDAEIVEAARASITALLSIDHTRARADVQRVIELSTGGFRDDFAKSADDFVKTAEDRIREFEILNDKRRLTVAITRAKQKLVMIGCIDCVKSYKTIGELVSILKESNYILKPQDVDDLFN